MSHANKHDEKEIIRLASQTLDRHTGDYDAATLSKLRQARERALDVARKRQSVNIWRWQWTVPVVTALVFAGFISWNLLQSQPVVIDEEPQWVEAGNSDMELLLSVDDLAFYEELDFLVWLDQEDYAS